MIFRARLNADLETRSPTPINEGTHRYAEHVSILLFLYALDEGEVSVWDVASGEPMPQDLHEYLSDPTVELAFHNAAFDRTVLMACGYGEEYPLEPERFLCTMTVARMARFPGSLDALCKALGLPEQYAKRDGNALIKKFCIPDANGRFTRPVDAPADWARFIAYGKHDVVAMRECMKRIPNVMNDAERMLYAYTTRMNDHGVAIDRELAVRCAFQVADLKTRFKREARQLVGEEEFNVVSQKALLGYLKSHGIELPDARISTVQDFLESEQAEVLPAVVLDVLRTRLKTNKAAVAKYPAILKRLNSDDRLRGLIVHAGAGNTHRDSSVGPQFQNLARPVLLDEKLTMEQACEIAKAGASELFFEDPMQLHSDCVRGTVIAPPGKKLCVADLSNIEGRSVVWLAGEEWKLKYFRDFDEGKIRFDNYVAAYAKAFNISPVSVTKAQRQVGKVLELACSYGGSVGAFITFAAIYRVDLDAMALAVREAGDAALWSDCDAAFDWFEDKQMTYGLSRDTWTGCYYLVKAWRAAHSAVVATWNRAEEAFTNAVKNPGVWFEGARDCHFFNSEGWVFCRLPSNRMMVFPKARLEDTGGRGSSLTFMGVSAFTKKWGVQRTYGGRLCIAEGTLVLTQQAGWIPIEQVAGTHRVWDGVEWVHTDGMVFNGVKEVIEAYGVHMTADHEVLTEAGWRSASQSKGLNRATCRLPDGVEVPRIRWQEKSLGSSVRLRDRAFNACKRIFAGALMRVQNKRAHLRISQNTRDEQASRVCGMAVHDRPLQVTYTSGVGELRCAWNKGVRTVAGIVRELLAGHGVFVQERAFAGPHQQQRPVLARELSVGYPQAEQPKPSQFSRGGQSAWPDVGVRTSGTNGYRADDAAISIGQKHSRGRLDSPAGSCAKVYDLTNCGPRSRFTVWADGAPLIVHNCENITQSFSRDVLLWNVPAVEQAGYPVVLRVHDELVTEPDDDPRFTGGHLAQLMATRQAWCADLPLAAVGEDLYRYQKS